jgi:hypothetical protein
MSEIRRIKFIVWRWLFLRFRLRGVIADAHRTLEEEYQAYRSQPLNPGQKYMSFTDWCGEYGNND